MVRRSGFLNILIMKGVNSMKPLLCSVCKCEIPRGHGRKCILHRRERGRKSISIEVNERQRHKRMGLKYYETHT